MQQFELTHEFLSQLEELIDAGNKTEVSKQIAGLHPADIAEILEELNNERAQFVFLLLDNEKAGDVLQKSTKRKEYILSNLFRQKLSPVALSTIWTRMMPPIW